MTVTPLYPPPPNSIHGGGVVGQTLPLVMRAIIPLRQTIFMRVTESLALAKALAEPCAILDECMAAEDSFSRLVAERGSADAAAAFRPASAAVRAAGAAIEQLGAQYSEMAALEALRRDIAAKMVLGRHAVFSPDGCICIGEAVKYPSPDCDGVALPIMTALLVHAGQTLEWVARDSLMSRLHGTDVRQFFHDFLAACVDFQELKEDPQPFRTGRTFHLTAGQYVPAKVAAKKFYDAMFAASRRDAAVRDDAAAAVIAGRAIVRPDGVIVSTGSADAA